LRAPELVLEDDVPDLLDLVSLRLRAYRLQVQDLDEAGSEEDVMAALGPGREPEPGENVAKIRERDVLVRGTSEDGEKGFLSPTHAERLALALGAFLSAAVFPRRA
jgi:hypothetical protein